MAQAAKTVLITGCSSGIGHETAIHMAGKGWKVFATARRPETLTELKSAGCETLACDVTSEESMVACVAEVEAATGGSIGALVNNAGYSQSGALEEVPIDAVRRQFETNVFGLLRMCQLVLPGMRKAAGGRIVNISSMGGVLTFPGGGIYHATKYSVEAMSDALRFEVAGFGIKVVIIQPGLIVTKFADAAVGSMAGAFPDEGPYAYFNKKVASGTAEAYKGPMSKLGAGPEAVAHKIEKALRASRPRTRYKVTASAGLSMAMRGVTTDRMWDRAMKAQFPQPRP